MLFKYLPVERKDVLLNQQIRFSPPVCLNDIFEVNPVLTDGISDDYLESLTPERIRGQLEYFWEMSPELHGTIPKETFLHFGTNPELRKIGYQIFRSNPEILAASAAKREHFVNSDLGILSLSECNDSELMWAHYSSDHRGMVLGLDETHPFLNSPTGEVGEYNAPHKISYSSERPKADIAKSTFLEQFLVKNADWNYEHEWRILKLLRTADKVIPVESSYPVCLFTIPAEAIKSICFGCRSAPELKAEIVSFLEDSESLSHIQVQQASPNTHSFGISIT